MRLYSLPKTPESLRFIRVVRKWLTRTPLMVCVLIILSPTLIAQRQDETRSMGFFFGGIGSCQHGYGFLRTGGGGQARLAGGLGITAEMGYLAYLKAPGRGVGLFSPGVVYSSDWPITFPQFLANKIPHLWFNNTDS